MQQSADDSQIRLLPEKWATAVRAQDITRVVEDAAGDQVLATIDIASYFSPGRMAHSACARQQTGEICLFRRSNRSRAPESH